MYVCTHVFGNIDHETMTSYEQETKQLTAIPARGSSQVTVSRAPLYTLLFLPPILFSPSVLSLSQDSGLWGYLKNQLRTWWKRKLFAFFLNWDQLCVPDHLWSPKLLHPNNWWYIMKVRMHHPGQELLNLLLLPLTEVSGWPFPQGATFLLSSWQLCPTAH